MTKILKVGGLSVGIAKDDSHGEYPWAVFITNDDNFFTDIAYAKTRKKARKIQAKLKKALP